MLKSLLRTHASLPDSLVLELSREHVAAVFRRKLSVFNGHDVEELLNVCRSVFLAECQKGRLNTDMCVDIQK